MEMVDVFWPFTRKGCLFYDLVTLPITDRHHLPTMEDYKFTHVDNLLVLQFQGNLNYCNIFRQGKYNIYIRL